ncbi:hypothetical protein B0T20DRAFT_72192 [Sordaria brevicollis]|uniref:Uncharacterized protein n=1 Tax=Sordaria brevicollis TaxID=83679 RepID=A0AAE0U652_SORBR|nr:hypothetical protein B0T20DRAFT_72192 [Sordaria brevicollis]
MSIRSPRFLNLGLEAGRPHLGPRGQGRSNEFSHLGASPTSTTSKSRFSTSTHLPHHTPRHSHHHHHHHRPTPQNNSNHKPNRSWNQQQRRHHSSSSNPNLNPNQARISRLISRLPRFLHPYLSSLRSSPTSFIVAFLILHEITAIVPGLGFFYLFHYAGDDDDDDDKNDSGNGQGKGSFGRRLEAQIMSWAMQDEDYVRIIMGNMERFERWFRRKGYFGFEKGEQEQKGDLGVVRGEDGVKVAVAEDEKKGEQDKLDMMKKWQSGVGDEKYRVLVDAALAYGVTKALLPLRIIVSVKATPWFAGVLGRVKGLFGGLRK